ncbi:ABC transporter permease/ATP-binding protein [Pseudomonas aeruginosa]|nr:ABC transporter permease/ATP-binding protein [Pseudomonas aeruginosa]
MMYKTFSRLLGDDAPIFHRYAWMAVVLGLLNGLVITALVPILGHLLAGDVHGAGLWLLALGTGLVACWAWRRQVEQASVALRVTVLRDCRQRIGDHIAGLPVGWFTPQNTARLNHAMTHGMFELSELPGHLFTPILSGVVTPLVFVVALTALHWPLGLIALLALPILAGIFVLSARLGQQADEAFHSSAAHTSQRIVEFAQAQSVLRAFSAGNGSMDFLRRAIDRQHAAGSRLLYVSIASVVLNAWAVQLAFAALLIAAALWLSSQLGMESQADTAVAVVASLLLVNRFIARCSTSPAMERYCAVRAANSTR